MNGIQYTFEVAGVYNGLFVMADRLTGSVWSHYEGKVMDGPLAGQGIAMDYMPTTQTTWAEWLALHPDTKVLDFNTGFEQRYRENVAIGKRGLSQQFLSTIINMDTRLDEFELILGVQAGSEYRAYILSEMPSGAVAINDSLGGEAIVVFSQDSTYATVFSSVVNDQVLIFTSNGMRITDNMGNVWSLDGICESGPFAGQSLGAGYGFVSEWYGWAAYHPDTSIYGR